MDGLEVICLKMSCVNPVRMNVVLPSWLGFWAWFLGRWDFCLGCSAVVWSEGCGWHVQVLCDFYS